MSGRRGKLIVAIAGGSASGKTTLAEALARAVSPIPVSILSADRYSRKGEQDAPTFYSPTTGEVEFDWNHPESYDYPKLIRDIDQDSADVIIVEGLMVLYNARLREMAKVRLFVDLSADQRALRRMLRDMAGGRTSADPHFIARYYLESAKVGHERYVEPSRQFADLIVRGDAEFDRVAALLAQGIGEF